MRRRNIPSPGHCTGKRLGVLTLANHAIMHYQRKTRQPVEPIYTEADLVRMRGEILARANPADMNDLFGLTAVDEWIQKKRPVAEGLIQQASAAYQFMMGGLCQTQLAEKIFPYLDMISESGVSHDSANYTAEPQSPLSELQLSLQEMVAINLTSSYLVEDRNGNTPALKVLNSRSNLLRAYYGLVGFNSMMDTINKSYLLPEMEYYLMDTEYVLDLIRRLNLQVLSLTYQIHHTEYSEASERSRKLQYLSAAFPLIPMEEISVPAERKRAIRNLMKDYKAFTQFQDVLTNLVFSPPGEVTEDWEV